MAERVDIDKLIEERRARLAARAEQGFFGDANRALGLTARAATPAVAGALAGAALGAPLGGVGAIPGAIAGATAATLARPISDLAVTAYNKLTGSNAGLPSQAIEDLMTRAGLPEPQTPIERTAQSAQTAMIDAVTGARGAKLVADAVAPNTTRQLVAQTLAEAPGAQGTAATIAAGTSQGAREFGAPEAVALPLGIAAGAVPFLARPSMLPSASTPERDANVARLRQAGVPVTPAQESGSPFQSVVESVMRYLPTSGPRVARVEDEQQRAFTQAIMRQAGIDADTATPEVLRAARKRFGEEYEAIGSQTLMRGDEQLFDDLLAIERDYVVGFPDAIKPTYKKRVDEVLKFASGEKQADAKEYMRLHSELSSEIGKADRASTPESSYYGAAMRGLQRALESAMERSTENPALRETLSDLNRRYALFNRVEEAMSMAGQDKMNTGFIPPRQIASVERAADPQRWAESGTPFTELVRSGAAIIPDPVPNSGTAQRSMAQDLLTGGKRGAPVGAAGAAGASAGLIDPVLTFGLPWLISRGWYAQPYSTPVAGLLGADAVRGAANER